MPSLPSLGSRAVAYCLPIAIGRDDRRRGLLINVLVINVLVINVLVINMSAKVKTILATVLSLG